MAKKILFEIKDLMRIRGYGSYSAAAREHKAIRDSLGLGKLLTVRQYCKFERLPYEEIIDFLTGNSGHPQTDLGEG